MLQNLDVEETQASKLPEEAFVLQLLSSLRTASNENEALSVGVKCAMQYRMSKKMVLWDAVAAISNATSSRPVT